MAQRVWKYPPIYFQPDRETQKQKLKNIAKCLRSSQSVNNSEEALSSHNYDKMHWDAGREQKPSHYFQLFWWVVLSRDSAVVPVVQNSVFLLIWI
jgi:hypothetical protein